MKRDLLFFVSGLSFGVAAGYFLFRALSPGLSNPIAPSSPAVSGSSIGLDDQQARRELDQEQIERLEARAESEPDNPGPRAELGRLYMDAGRYPEAIVWLEASVELEPSDLHVRNQLALCYLNAENLDSAVTSYEETLRLDPNHPASLLSLGRIKLYVQRDIEGGLAMWARLIDVAPGTSEAAGVVEELEALKSAHPGS